MRFQQSRDLHRHFFTAFRRARNLRGLCDISSHGETYAAQQLNALGNRINQFHLLLKCLSNNKCS